MDLPVLAEVVRLELSHCLFHTRTVKNEAQAMAVPDRWHPQVAIVDMDTIMPGDNDDSRIIY